MNKNIQNIPTYLMNRNEMDDISVDRSLVELRDEKLTATILNIIGSCFLNNTVFIISNVISTVNLIILGHIFLQNKTNYELFMTFQIGVSITDFFGKIIIIGLLRYIFEKKDYRKIYFTYLNLKIGLVIIIPVLMIPVSLSSFFIIKFLLRNSLDIYYQTLNKEVYFKFLLFTPLIYFFEILFYLNLKILRALDKNKAVIFYTNFYIISHVLSCWILLYFLKFGIFGLTISYFLNSFLFYLFSNSYIKDEDDTKNFFVFPPIDYLDINVINTLKEAFSLSIRFLTDSFLIYFIFIISLFTDKNQLIVNIIYVNFYSLIIGINKGFYINFRHYLLHSNESYEEKKKYIIVFCLTFIILIISLFTILLIFKNILLNIYLINGGNKILKLINNRVRIIYSLCVLFNGIQILLYGFIRGMASPSPIFIKVIYTSICIFLSLILCFVYELGILGLWVSVLILCLFYCFVNGYKSTTHFNNIFFK